jgi:hypothetical protein
MYDWCVKAVAIQEYPEFYDQLTVRQLLADMFDSQGKFQQVKEKDRKIE